MPFLVLLSIAEAARHYLLVQIFINKDPVQLWVRNPHLHRLKAETWNRSRQVITCFSIKIMYGLFNLTRPSFVTLGFLPYSATIHFLDTKYKSLSLEEAFKLNFFTTSYKTSIFYNKLFSTLHESLHWSRHTFLLFTSYLNISLLHGDLSTIGTHILHLIRNCENWVCCHNICLALNY